MRLHLFEKPLQGEVYRAAEFRGLVLRGGDSDKVAVIEFQGTFEIVVQRRYIHYEFVQHTADKIFFSGLYFRGDGIAERQCLEGGQRFIGEGDLFHRQYMLVEYFSDKDGR